MSLQANSPNPTEHGNEKFRGVPRETANALRAYCYEFASKLTQNSGCSRARLPRGLGGEEPQRRSVRSEKTKAQSRKSYHLKSAYINSIQPKGAN